MGVQYFMDARGAGPVILTVDAGELSADLKTIDWLARLALQARRQGARIVLRDASAELRGLIELAGLGDTLADAWRYGPSGDR